MKTTNDIHEKILDQSSYWVEGINGSLYNAVLNFMEANDLNRTKLASHLGISKGRVSQILNDGEINFSLEKIIEIALKVGKYPTFEFQDKQSYLEKKSKLSNTKTITLDFNNKAYSNLYEEKTYKNAEPKVISLQSNQINNIQIAVN